MDVIDNLHYFFIHLLFSFLICSFIYWSTNQSQLNESEIEYELNNNEEKKETRYEEKYMEQFHNMSIIELTEEQKEMLKNNILFETTPLGLVIMFYRQKKECFEFYSDYTIPYRFLETIGRKYVLTYNCKTLFVDMEEELKLAKEKLEAEEKEKQEKEKKLSDEKLNGTSSTSSNDKKNVFAKFKTYNKETTKQVVSAPAKNQGTKDVTTNTKNMLLKENANKYSYGGRISNFSILKKVDKKLVDKRLAMTFAEFKKLHEEIKK